MKAVFLNIIQSILDKVEVITYERVDEDILSVGTNDKGLNRTIDLSFDSSLRIQVGTAMNYFEDEEANEYKVFEAFIFILYSEIEEVHFCKGARVLKTEYQIRNLHEVKNIGSNSYLSSLWKKEDNIQTIKRPSVINEEQYKYLQQELSRLSISDKI